MISHDKKNFLISIVASIIIFIVAYLAGSYIYSLTSRIYGVLAFFLILIIGLIFFVWLMHRYRKRP